MHNVMYDLNFVSVYGESATRRVTIIINCGEQENYHKMEQIKVSEDNDMDVSYNYS